MTDIKTCDWKNTAGSTLKFNWALLSKQEMHPYIGLCIEHDFMKETVDNLETISKIVFNCQCVTLTV